MAGRPKPKEAQRPKHVYTMGRVKKVGRRTYHKSNRVYQRSITTGIPTEKN